MIERESEGDKETEKKKLMGSRKKICTAVLPVLFASLWHYETVMSGLCSL